MPIGVVFILFVALGLANSQPRERELAPFPTSEVPRRSEERREAARRCVLAHGNRGARAFFIHNRKAGGTTIRKWLGGHQLCHNRFLGFVNEAEVMNVTRLAENGTLFVTALRRPVERILSSYKFEGEGPFSKYVYDRASERTRANKFRIWMEARSLLGAFAL